MNTAAVVPFYFQSHEVRTTMIENEPWFVAKDVCDILDLSDTYRAVQSLDDDEKGTKKVRTLGGEQEMIIISESGLYTLTIRSNKSESKPFRKWVTAEVLPAIRKTGTYTQTSARPPIWPDNAHALALAKTREGELMARELTLGVKVARAIGLHGRRQILAHAAALVDGRIGVCPLEYFGVKLDKHFPKIAVSNDCIGEFIASECRICPDKGGLVAEPRVRIRTVYDLFVVWYGHAVDDRLRFLPSIKAVSKELFRQGAGIRKIGGTSYACGVILVDSGVIDNGGVEVAR